MIVSQIRELAVRRGIENANQLKEALDVSPTLAARLWRGDFERIGMNTLDRLCTLLKCQVGSLLKYESND
jgi:DNA-binding Xre family transcriptional regulator